MLFLLSVDILVISEYDTYADTNSFGASVHLVCVIILGVLFTLAPILTAFGLRKVGRKWYLFSLGTAFVWAPLSAVFFLTPTAWDGAYERFLSLIVISWVSAVSWLLVQAGWRSVEASLG